MGTALTGVATWQLVPVDHQGPKPGAWLTDPSQLLPTFPPPLLAPQATSGNKQVTVSEKKLRVAINGFGRIGRQFLRCLEGRDDCPLELIAVNDSGGVKQAAHLTKYDSTMGTFDADVKVGCRPVPEPPACFECALGVSCRRVPPADWQEPRLDSAAGGRVLGCTEKF